MSKTPARCDASKLPPGSPAGETASEYAALCAKYDRDKTLPLPEFQRWMELDDIAHGRIDAPRDEYAAGHTGRCNCGHAAEQHEWHDELASCCMARVYGSFRTGEGTPCPCSGFSTCAVPEPVPTEGAADKQQLIDVSNLRFYGLMFEEHQWQTDVLHWTVFVQTLNEMVIIPSR